MKLLEGFIVYSGDCILIEYMLMLMIMIIIMRIEQDKNNNSRKTPRANTQAKPRTRPAGMLNIGRSNLPHRNRSGHDATDLVV